MQTTRLSLEESREPLAKGLVTTQPLIQAFEEAGYSVEAPGVIRGSSSAAHGFDIVASKARAEGAKVTVVIDVASSSLSINENSIISFVAKVFDVSPTKAILAAIPSLNKTAKKLASRYKLTVIEGPSVEHTISQLRRMLTSQKHV